MCGVPLFNCAIVGIGSEHGAAVPARAHKGRDGGCGVMGPAEKDLRVPNLSC